MKNFVLTTLLAVTAFTFNYSQDIEVITQEKIQGVITIIAYSPDGSLIASGSARETSVKVWDVNSGKIIGKLEGHESATTAIEFNRDGTMLFTSAKDDRTVRIALPLTTVFMIVMTISLIWMGMGLRALPEEVIKSYPESYLAILDPALNISPWFLGYVLMVFLSITMSTQSAACYVFTSTVNKIFLNQGSDSEKDQKRYISRSRRQMALLIVLSALASLGLSDIVKVIFDLLSFFICLAPVYVLAVLNPPWLRDWKIRDKALGILMVLAIGAFLLMFFTGLTKTSLLLSTAPAIATALLIAAIYAYMVCKKQSLKRKKS